MILMLLVLHHQILFGGEALKADPLHGEEKHIRIKYKNVLVIHGYSVIEILV